VHITSAGCSGLRVAVHAAFSPSRVDHSLGVDRYLVEVEGLGGGAVWRGTECGCGDNRSVDGHDGGRDLARVESAEGALMVNLLVAGVVGDELVVRVTASVGCHPDGDDGTGRVPCNIDRTARNVLAD
jgi:hypothetical protein